MRLLGVNILEKKNVRVGLMSIFGIGKKLSLKICNFLNIDVTKKINNLSQKEIENIKNYLSSMNLEGNLKKEINSNIKKKIELNTYHGIRHKRKLPVRGQRTRTNSKTVRKINR